MLNKKALAATAGGAKVYVEDVFSTYLYTGNGGTQTITNDIDLSGKGGMVWVKGRSIASNNLLFDTARGAGTSASNNQALSSNLTSAEDVGSTSVDYLSTFGSTGFTVVAGDGSTSEKGTNNKNDIYTSWTFRKQAKFFDVVTYTGNGTTQNISHNLGSTPGCVIIKNTAANGDWQVWHRGATSGNYLVLNSTAAQSTSNAISKFGNNTTTVDPTSTSFTVGSETVVNKSAETYVAYLFAHDAGGFGYAGDQNVISCGSFTNDGSGNATVTLGYEPQFLLLKVTNTTSNWTMVDTTRGLVVDGTGSGDPYLYANTSAAEALTGVGNPTATGFETQGFVANATYVYIAIRRGPMKTPTDATKVFTPTVYTGTNADNRLVSTTIAPDMVWIRQRDDTVVPGMYLGSRLTGQEFLLTGANNIAASDLDSFDTQLVGGSEYGNAFSSMSGVYVGNDITRKFNANTTADNHIIHAFKRAPGFFDVVCYKGTGSNTTISHNLGVVPELILVKKRDTATENWAVYSAGIANTEFLVLNTTAAKSTGTTRWNSTTPTSSVFSIGTNAAVNTSGNAYIAFLFASLSGVSKVGTYTGNGTSQTINCGFTAGARFILIKRTDNAGDWCVFDSARGIVASSDPFIQLNSSAAEVTNEDAVDTDNTGFVVNETTEALNTNSATYIYLAIA